MRFKIDENLPAEFAEILRKAGFDAVTVMEQGLNGEPDPRIIEVCQREERAFATLDTDFSNIRAYPPGAAMFWMSKCVMSVVLVFVGALGERPPGATFV